MKTITITVGDLSLSAELNQSGTAEEIWNALPIEGTAVTWGEEIYFSIPLILGPEAGARADVEVGDLGYWPPGHAFCIFFGPTPASAGQAPRAASPVNIFGKVVGGATVLKEIRAGSKVKITRAA
jgi:hypothetical protein